MSLYGGTREKWSSEGVLCDLRSDTTTAPDEGMRAAMAAAEVGDDVYGEDPTVTRLEQRMANLLGKEAAVFFPTGTQSNLAAVMAHCGRGDELIIGDQYHLYCDEAAGASVLAGVSMNAIRTLNNGALAPDEISAAIKSDDPHYARSRLLCLENSASGRVVPLVQMKAAAQTAWDNGLSVHFDGARFFNATEALKCEASALADNADSVSVCMSKGLGAPAGSVLVGCNKFAADARRHRKILGGAMRQSGVLAAAALFALDHNLPALAFDHDRATRLAEALAGMGAGDVKSATNMVFLRPRNSNPSDLREHMSMARVRIGGQSPTIRMVLHRDVSDEGLEAAIDAFRSYFKTKKSDGM